MEEGGEAASSECQVREMGISYTQRELTEKEKEEGGEKKKKEKKNYNLEKVRGQSS